MAIQLSGSLQLTGSLFVDGDPVVLANQTSSLSVSSASFASTASYADAFTVAGEIVAQTLNVQQVTSSVVYSSGSNVFGNSVSNTQQFTGSLQVSGSTHYLLGSVGIETDNPSEKLHVVGNILGSDSLYLGNSNKRISQNGDAIRIWNRTVNDIEFLTNDITRIIVKGDGNVGIGTTSPSTYAGIAGTRVLAVGSTTGNNGVNVVSGTTSTGTYTFSDSGGNDRGGLVYYHTADLMTILTAGTEQIRILSNGNVGIGTTSPNAKLQVTKGSSGNVASFTSDASLINNYSGITLHSQTIGTDDWYGSEIRSINTAGNPNFLNPRLGFFTQDYSTYLPAGRTEKMSILGNGNVGIGTTTPSAKLEVNGYTAVGVYAAPHYTQSGMAYQVIKAPGGLDSQRALLEIHSGGGGTKLSIQSVGGNNTTYVQTLTNSNVVFGNDVSYFYFNTAGNVGLGTTSPSFQLHVSKAGNTGIFTNNTVGDTGGYVYAGALGGLEIQSVNAANDTAQKLLLQPYGGNVGIGTTSPSSRLDLTNVLSSGNLGQTQYGALNIRIANTVGAIGQVNFSNDAAPEYGYGGIGMIMTSGVGVGLSDMIFYTKDVGTNADSTERMRIKSDGNIGIGTTSPVHKLDVAGVASFGTSTQTQIGNAADNPTDAGISYGMFHHSGVGLGIASGAGGSTQGTVFWSNNGSSYFQAARISGANGNVFIGPTLTASGYDSVKNGWILNYEGGGSTVANFSGNNEIFTFNQRDGLGTTEIDFRNGDVERGKIVWTTSGTTYNTSSDYRLKTNINTLTGALDKVLLLEPKTFNYIDGNNVLVSGFIAHEVQDIVPEAVTGQKDELRKDGTPKYQGMDHSRLVPFLVGAVKELKAENDALKSRLEALEQA
jgi:hypothetical protein